MINRYATLLLCGLFHSAATAHAADVYKIDPVHTSIGFKIGHLGVSNIYGRFNDVFGTVTFDKEAPAKSAVEFSIPVESVDTHVEKRDQHLKSPDFFNAKQFPLMTFKSTAVKQKAADLYEITGDFTLHGVTKPITVDFKKIGEGKGMQNEFRAGGETQFTIKRSDFGMDFMPKAVSDEVTVMIAIEGIKQ
ncbi:MAG: YceI family protein [Chthoniobacteraceae bacterium]|nr:YceI family protein [Chthoniobacteraceae bacterium]MDB6171481.1 YceI family protein [Chthoniobacteraceae bacterium]